MIRLVLLALAALASPAAAQHRAAELEALLAADRAFAAAAADAPTAADGVLAMLDTQVVMPAGPAGLVAGREAVVAILRANPAWQEGRGSWAPVRGGISADGTHGFTFGFLTLGAGDPARRERKYLAYWIRRPQGWRAVAWRQVPRAPGAVSTEMLAPSLPTHSAAPGGDGEAHRAGLHAAEQAFSDHAQQVGLRAAFRDHAREDAMNMGAGPGFVFGPAAISEAVAPEGSTSPVRWSTERSFVAPAGDLGVSIGTIRVNGPVPEGQPASFPFFTIWRRDGPQDPWRYIAE